MCGTVDRPAAVPDLRGKAACRAATGIPPGGPVAGRLDDLTGVSARTSRCSESASAVSRLNSAAAAAASARTAASSSYAIASSSLNPSGAGGRFSSAHGAWWAAPGSGGGASAAGSTSGPVVANFQRGTQRMKEQLGAERDLVLCVGRTDRPTADHLEHLRRSHWRLRRSDSVHRHWRHLVPPRLQQGCSGAARLLPLGNRHPLRGRSERRHGPDRRAAPGRPDHAQEAGRDAEGCGGRLRQAHSAFSNTVTPGVCQGRIWRTSPTTHCWRSIVSVYWKTACEKPDPHNQPA